MGSYKVAGVFDVTYNDHGKNLKVLHFNFNGGIFMQVNQWTNPDEGHFINVFIEMGKMPGLDGYCGNMNGNAADDDRMAIRQRMGSSGIPQSELIGFRTKTPVATTYKNYPAITACASPLLISSHTACQKEEGHFIPSMDCLAKKCAQGRRV